jgi:hypothetical protein
MNLFSGRACSPSFAIAALIIAASITTARSEDGFVDLFASGTLQGWTEEQHDFFVSEHPNTLTWKIHDGIVSCDGSGGNSGFLRYEKKLCDFVLRVEYRMSAGCNSGVSVRAAVPYKTGDLATRPSQVGLEIQILDDVGDDPHPSSSGAIYDIVPPKVNASKAIGEWNDLEITCVGTHLLAKLNGKVIQDLDYTKVEAFKDRPRCGFISLQNHGEDIDFRHVRLKELPTKP